jgi:hypothetical protein
LHHTVVEGQGATPGVAGGVGGEDFKLQHAGLLS